MSKIEDICEGYNGDLQVGRANFVVSDEERAAFAAEHARVVRVFDGLVGDRGVSGHSGNRGRTFYRPVDMGGQNVDGELTRVVVEPSTTAWAYGLHVAAPIANASGFLNFTNSRTLGQFELRRDADPTKDGIANLVNFGQLLDQMAAVAAEEVPATA